jgi:6,7-dimethyl-8-ribityllumazine synthase
MASHLKNLSDPGSLPIPSAKTMRFMLLTSEWNSAITLALLKGAHATLVQHGAVEENIHVHYVPGSFELSFGAQLAAAREDIDTVICLGCVIQGETRHFDFICNAIADGITAVSLKYNKPVIFGVLTTNTLEQAEARSGGKHGNKGDEAAITAIKMVALKQKLA